MYNIWCMETRMHLRWNYCGQLYDCIIYFLFHKHVHRRLYNWVAYILLFQNAFVGFFSAILRVLKSALFGLIIVTRLDRVLYMKGFERFDSGNTNNTFFCLWVHLPTFISITKALTVHTLLIILSSTSTRSTSVSACLPLSFKLFP